MARPLEGLFVLDLTTTLAGSYCTKLWVDAGAEVLKVEPPEGDPLRRRRVLGSPAPAGEHSPLSSFLHAGKGSEVADLTTAAGQHRLLDLARSADLLVESAAPGTSLRWGSGAARSMAANPGLTIVSITPFGQSGPWADRPATEFTLQAASGSIGGRGTPERPPVAAGGQLGDWITGTWAAIGGLAAWRRAHATGRGDHVDVSAFEWSPSPSIRSSRSTPRSPAIATTSCAMSTRARWRCPPSSRPATAGWDSPCSARSSGRTSPSWSNDPSWATTPDWRSSWGAGPARADVEGPVEAWTRRHTVDEIVELASAFRIPVAPIGTGATIPGMTHFREVGTYVEGSEPGVLWPRVPYRLAAQPQTPPGQARSRPRAAVAPDARHDARTPAGARHHRAAARRSAHRRLHRALGRPAGHAHSGHARRRRGQGRVGPTP